MLSFLKRILGLTPVTDYKELVRNGAIIVDVRSEGEYKGGHIEGSLNVPVSNLLENFSKIEKTKTIITCCASGMRSGAAKTILMSSGYEDVHNGGSWSSLQGKI
jgi:phage shock protein E